MDSAHLLAVAAYVGVGLLAGLLAGLLGVGGGIVMVPLLLRVFAGLGYQDPDLLFHVAAATSLAVIIPTALSSALTHARHGNVLRRSVLAMAPAGIVAVHLASLVAARTAGGTLRHAFGVVLLVVSLQMTFFTPKPRAQAPIPSWIAFSLVGAVAGALSFFFGIGGGVAAVPMMVLLLGTPIHVAVGTSSALIVFLAIYGTARNAIIGQGVPDLPEFSWGYVNLLAVACITPASVLTARAGANLAQRVKGTTLRRLFAIALALEGLRLALGK
jgi:uncharacterized membrane protein YfcA